MVRIYPWRRRYIEETGALAFVSLLTIIGLILLLLRGADGVDAISKSSEEALLKNGFAARILELRASVVPQTDWDDAVTHLDQHFDPEWASANVGTFLTQSSGFELVSVLDSRETQVFGFDRGEPARPALLRALSAQTAPLVAQVRRQEAQRGRFHVTPGNTRMISSPIQAAAVSDVAGAPYVLVATLVQPDFGTALPKGDRAPIVITGEAIDAPFLSLLVQRYRLSEAEIVPASSRANGAKAAVSINDAHGRQLLSLRWRPHRPGDSFLRATLLYIAASLSLGIAALLYFSIAAQRAKESLKRALVVAQDANLAKSEFLASMSHEIRTPLNGVIGGLNLLKSESLTVEGSQLLRNAVDSGEMVNAIINDILDFSKIEAQEMTLASVPTDVDVLLRSVAALFESQCRQKGLQFECQIDSSVEWAELDPLRLKQCLFNLLGNAVKFTREGRVRVVARFEQREQRRVFCVDASDTGIGVSQAAHFNRAGKWFGVMALILLVVMAFLWVVTEMLR